MKNLQIKCRDIKQRQNAPECVLVECGSFGMIDDENAEIRNPMKAQGVFANLIWNVLGGIATGIVIFFILFGWLW